MSHQVLIRLKALRGLKAALLLEKANIFASKMELMQTNDLRVKVAEVTRTEMREDNMRQVAMAFRQALRSKERPSTGSRREVPRVSISECTLIFFFDRTA